MFLFCRKCRYRHCFLPMLAEKAVVIEFTGLGLGGPHTQMYSYLEKNFYGINSLRYDMMARRQISLLLHPPSNTNFYLTPPPTQPLPLLNPLPLLDPSPSPTLHSSTPIPATTTPLTPAPFPSPGKTSTHDASAISLYTSPSFFTCKPTIPGLVGSILRFHVLSL